MLYARFLSVVYMDQHHSGFLMTYKISVSVSFGVLAGINHGQVSTGESFNFYPPLPLSSSLGPSPLLIRKWFEPRSNIPQLLKKKIYEIDQQGLLILN